MGGSVGSGVGVAVSEGSGVMRAVESTYLMLFLHPDKIIHVENITAVKTLTFMRSHPKNNNI